MDPQIIVRCMNQNEHNKKRLVEASGNFVSTIMSAKDRNNCFSTAADCPPNSQYNLCMQECSHDCGDISGTTCVDVFGCLEGCQCDPGFIFQEGECIRQSECGCEDSETGAFVPVR